MAFMLCHMAEWGLSEVATRSIRTISAFWSNGPEYAVFLQMPILSRLQYKEMGA